MARVLIVSALVTAASAAMAAVDTAALCSQAAALASARTGVPISVLKAIMLAETGRNQGGALRPWPWTVNMEGKGLWFESEATALAYADEHFQRGATSFDVGCFQINYKWHHAEFASLEAMFDPVQNASYAARFLKSLFEETGDWGLAAGAYHSRSPEHAEPYRARFEAIRARFLEEDGVTLPQPGALLAVANEMPPATLPGASVAPLRVNTFPLLQSGGARGLGSLVPIGTGRPGLALVPADKTG